ncbi:MAG: hypothetical protein KJP10_09080 [Gammaproteobacteria bacterium]|nr:hypothetical protein [Gammaproteobacteria bacterium]
MDSQMMNFLKNRLPLLCGGTSRQEPALVNAENEFLAMSCGSFNPRFLEKIKRCKADNERSHNQGRIHIDS